jgi:hypothetical protein
MRKITRAFTGLAAAALAVGMAGPALAATQARPLERVPAHAAFQPGSGQSVIDGNHELVEGITPTVRIPGRFCSRTAALPADLDVPCTEG